MPDNQSAPMPICGKVALVTGGSRGLGRAVSTALAGSGVHVLINYRTDESGARETLEIVNESGGSGKMVQFDVADPRAVDENITSLTAEYGFIDILVNNAGISKDGLLGRMSDDDWSSVIQTNLNGVFYTCRAVSKNMIRKRKGRIINIASTAGESGNAGQANYSASKAGMIGFTKSLARELAPRNILVNAVAPGIISGGLTSKLTQDQIEQIRSHVPLRREGKPEDVAGAVLFLSSEYSNYITGQVLRVNGGLYM
jgi:3-oxoacyl-[acyl-carrier protein] reductase